MITRHCLRSLDFLLIFTLLFVLHVSFGWKFQKVPIVITGNNNPPTSLNFKGVYKKIMSACIIGSTLMTFDPQSSRSVEEIKIQTSPSKPKGKSKLDGEAERIFIKAEQIESNGDFVTSQKLYEQIIEIEPDYIYAWSNLGNALVAQGSLDEGLLCYNKALSLQPPAKELSVLLLNRASVEISLGKTKLALRDLDGATRLSGSSQEILTNQALAYSIEGDWSKASEIFDKVISSADRNALPWWLRYSMALLETSRGVEAVAYLQRILNRYPLESESTAFAVALYSSLGSEKEAQRYWTQLPQDEQAVFSEAGHVENKLHWGPIACKNFQMFLKTRNLALFLN